MTITLEQAKKLHELGVRKHCEKAWWYHEYTGRPFVDTSGRMGWGKIKPIALAYSAEELLAMMSYFHVALEQAENKWWCYDNEPAMPHATIHGATLTEALGNKLIYDIENNIITIEDINK